MSEIKCQAAFIKALKDSNSPVCIYLVNGIKLQGVISDSDDEVILLKNNITQMVYKSAISTIVPGKAPQR